MRHLERIFKMYMWKYIREVYPCIKGLVESVFLEGIQI